MASHRCPPAADEETRATVWATEHGADELSLPVVSGHALGTIPKQDHVSLRSVVGYNADGDVVERWTPSSSVSGGVATRAQAPQVLQHVTPAPLTRENVIDLGGERPALDAAEAVTLERLRPDPTPSAG